VTITRSNPNPGTWDIHIFGRPIFAQSKYSLSVGYTKIEASQKEVQGDLSALAGTIDMSVKEASLDATPDAEKSTYTLSALYQESKEAVAEQERLIVSRPSAKKYREYGEGVESVVISTGGSSGNDLDLEVQVCDDKKLSKNCKRVGDSTTPTDIESVQFEPEVGKYYYAAVTGFSVSKQEGVYVFSETQNLKEQEQGTVEISAGDDQTFSVAYSLKSEKLAQLSEFTSGSFGLAGAIELKTALGEPLITIPVRVSKEAKALGEE
jgi:hypothetical protein